MIATGTPPGVGVAREPKRFLREGDVVTVGIDGIGALSNPCIATIGAVSLPSVDRCGRGGNGQ